MAVRAVRLERNWSSLDGPRSTREITLHPAMVDDVNFLLYASQAKLLRGGEYLLFLNSTKLECWRVATNEAVWKQTTDWNTYDFDFEVVNEGKDARIALAIRVQTPPTKFVLSHLQVFYSRRRFSLVQVISLNLEDGVPTLIATRILPEVQRTTALYRIKIQDSIVVASMPDLEAFRGQLFVMNWELKACLFLTGVSIAPLYPPRPLTPRNAGPPNDPYGWTLSHLYTPALHKSNARYVHARSHSALEIKWPLVS